jgi:hypothetical protein
MIDRPYPVIGVGAPPTVPSSWYEAERLVP